MSQQKEIIVTGVNGFVGGHLAKLLSEMGYRVHGIAREAEVRSGTTPYLARYTSADLLDKTSFDDVDLTDTSAIIHLAGLASVAESFEKPDLFREANAAMVDTVLAACLTQYYKRRVVVISTGAIYASPQATPLTEASRIKATSPYAEGKVRAEEVAYQYREKGLDVVIARPFNHIGPGQATGFLLSDLYDQIVEAQKIGATTISVGNLKTKRDYTDVRDIVKAYEKLASADKLSFDTYNVCSGISYSGEQLFEELRQAMKVSVEAVIDPARVRPTDAAEIIGDSSRLHKEIGWKPSIPLSQTVRDFVDQR